MLWLGERLHCGSNPDENLRREEKGSSDGHRCAGSSSPSEVLCSWWEEAREQTKKPFTGRKQRGSHNGSFLLNWHSVYIQLLGLSIPTPSRAAALVPTLLHSEAHQTCFRPPPLWILFSSPRATLSCLPTASMPC